MESDPLIDEIRRIRHEISARYGHDTKRYMEHLREYEEGLRRSGKYRFLDEPKPNRDAGATAST